MAERPSLGRDDSYNRVTVSRDLKSQIMAMIADSSESLPLGVLSETDEDAPSTVDGKKAWPGATDSTSNLATQEPLNASDIATPTPEKPNPLEQVPTVRVDSKKPETPTSSSTPAADKEEEVLGVANLATPSPMRSHEHDGPELGKLGKRISRLVSHSQTDVAANTETQQLGTTASRTSTVSQTPSSAKDAKVRPGLDKRQSTVKRISSAFKRTVSKNQ